MEEDIKQFTQNLHVSNRLTVSLNLTTHLCSYTKYIVVIKRIFRTPIFILRITLVENPPNLWKICKFQDIILAKRTTKVPCFPLPLTVLSFFWLLLHKTIHLVNHQTLQPWASQKIPLSVSDTGEYKSKQRSSVPSKCFSDTYRNLIETVRFVCM